MTINVLILQNPVVCIRKLITPYSDEHNIFGGHQLPKSSSIIRSSNASFKEKRYRKEIPLFKISPVLNRSGEAHALGDGGSIYWPRVVDWTVECIIDDAISSIGE